MLAFIHYLPGKFCVYLEVPRCEYSFSDASLLEAVYFNVEGMLPVFGVALLGQQVYSGMRPFRPGGISLYPRA